ncbi:MAG: prepilin-type N-terminal cleavage/methylation domain-containing protein [Candidatus Omnitrophota bacterium]
MHKTWGGFTLVEMMIVIAVSAIIIFGAFTILQVSNRQLQIMHAKMSLQEGPREALFKMAQELRQTAWHKIEDTFGTADANGVRWASTLSFIVPVPSPDESSLVDANFAPKWAHNVQYSLDTTTHQILRTSTDLATNVIREAVLANEVTILEFSRKSATPGLITITAEAQRVLSNGEMIPETPLRMTTVAEARNP